MSKPTHNCDLCGACCRTFPIFASKSDAAREPAVSTRALELKPWLKTSDWEYQLHPLPFMRCCAFLDEGNLCSIYSTRPDVCRRFEAGSPQCAEARSFVGMAELPASSKRTA